MTVYADLSRRRTVRVTGADARAWLGDLLTADIAGLETGTSTVSLLLTPTGRIRAVVCVAALDDAILLTQDPAQPDAIDALLAPYVLSSDVAMEDASEWLAVFAFTEGDAPSVPEGRTVAPSCWLGAGGVDLIVPAERAAEVRTAAGGLRLLDDAALARAAVEAGAARFPFDLIGDSLPHEVRFEHAVDDTKGCYLGQEAVAKIRNLGHPPWVILRMRADGRVEAGDPVIAGDREVGVVTGTAGQMLLARVRWAAREDGLRTAGGTSLRTLGLAYVRA